MAFHGFAECIDLPSLKSISLGDKSFSSLSAVIESMVQNRLRDLVRSPFVAVDRVGSICTFWTAEGWLELLDNAKYD